MIPRQVKQKCLKCKGSGVSDKVLTNKDGQVMLAPPYVKGEGDRPQYENCKVCQGEGVTLQNCPTEIFIDGEKVVLNEEEARARYATNA